jgi:hypothetical protein
MSRQIRPNNDTAKGMLADFQSKETTSLQLVSTHVQTNVLLNLPFPIWFSKKLLKEKAISELRERIFKRVTWDISSLNSNHFAAVDDDVDLVAQTSFGAAAVAAVAAVAVVADGDASVRWHCLWPCFSPHPSMQ